jgi:Fic/DOC family
MDLPMAAKKTRKPSKKPRNKATKPARSRTAALKKRALVRPKARVKKAVSKAKVRAKPRAKTRAKPQPKVRAKVRAKPEKPRKAKKLKKLKTARTAKLTRRASTVKRAVKRPVKRRKVVAPRRAAAPKRKLAPKKAPKRKLPVERSPRPPARKAKALAGAAKPARLLARSVATVASPSPSRHDGGSKPAGAARGRLGGVPDKKAPPVSQASLKQAPPKKPEAKPLAKRGEGPRSDRPGERRSSPVKPPKEKPSLRGQGRAPLREAPPRLVALPLPILPPPKRPSVEERGAVIEARLMAQTDDFRKRYEESLDMSWIYHDSALEGVVYTFEELRTALSGQAPPVTDSSLQPTYDDIRRHKEAIEFVRDYGLRKKLPVTVDIIKKIYLILHPEEGDIKTVKYRKDIPQHRLYFHEYAPPDKIAYKVRQIVDWLNDPETRKTRNGVRIAARAHYDMLRVYPFPVDSGKVARLFMNLMLMRTGLPPAIVHSTERQRYYEALKGSATTVLQMVQEAVENALSSVEKLLDEHETRKRAFVS